MQNGQHDTCGLCPSLVLSDQEDWNTCKHMPFRICSSSNSPNGSNGATWEHNNDIRPALGFCENQETLEMVHRSGWSSEAQVIDRLDGSAG